MTFVYTFLTLVLYFFSKFCFYLREKVQPNQSHMVDLLDVDLAPVDPWGMPQPPRPQVDVKIISLIYQNNIFSLLFDISRST